MRCVDFTLISTISRTREEVQEVRQNKDPITGLREKLVSSGLASAEELKVRRLLTFEFTFKNNYRMK